MEDIIDFSFEVCAESTDEAVLRAKAAMYESIDSEGFISIPVTGGAVNGKIAIVISAISSENIIYAKVLD